jgi:cytochrome P450
VHTRLRKLLTAAFTPRRVAEMRPAIQRFADELLDRFAAQGGCDLVAAFARPLPIRVFRELFGIPDSDGDEVFHLAGMLFMPNAADRQHRAAAMAKMQSYLVDLVRRKQRDPGGDLLSALIRARDVAERLTEEELTGMVAVLMSAGSQTTTHLISNSVITLFRNPGLAATLAAQPGLVPPAVEEVLRHEGPVPVSGRRFATEDLTIGDTRISQGEPVLFALAAADRDPCVFPDAGRFDHERVDAQRHMAFGHGIHHCVGAALARLEGTIALATLVRRLPGLALAIPVEKLRWQDYVSVRGVHELPVTWDPGRSGY